MYQNRSEYDRGVNTFSPEGRLFQVEYAIEAIKLGSTAVGVRCPEGVVLAVEKRLTSPLMVSTSVEKLFEIDSHVGIAVSGLTADARTIVEHARVQSQQHRFTFNEPLQVEGLTQIICDLALQFGEDVSGGRAIMSRPFGVALLIGGVDSKGVHLFYADPSGTFLRYNAKAIGAGSEVAQTNLQEVYKSDSDLNAAIKLAVKTLKDVMEEKLSASNFQIAIVTPESGFRILSDLELEGVAI